MTRPEKIRLGEILVQQNLISAEDLKKSLEEQKITGHKLGRIFVDNGYVTETQIYEALARQLEIPLVDIQEFYTIT